MHRFIILVEDRDAEKLSRWASRNKVDIREHFISLEKPVTAVQIIDAGPEPTDEELEAAVNALGTYDERLADAFRADIATGTIDRASTLRALQQFTRTRAVHLQYRAQSLYEGDCDYPVTEES